MRPRPADTWHLDEMVVPIRGRRMYVWRAVDSEGEILDLPVQPKRDKAAALRLMRKLFKNSGFRDRQAPVLWRRPAPARARRSPRAGPAKE
jgi:transposase-like protein